MKSVLLALAGPFQSWGTRSHYSHRGTDREPSKSGVLGLVAAALGIPKGDDPATQELSSLTMAVRVDREGTLLRDFHTAGGGYFRGEPYGVVKMDDGKLNSNAVLTDRFYLQDAFFVVALSGKEELLERVAAAVQTPKWVLFLGRRNCPPTRPVYLSGPIDGSPLECLAQTPWQAWRWGFEESPPERLRCIVESPEGVLRKDVPLSTSQSDRNFSFRRVKTQWIETSSLPPRKTNVSDQTQT